MLPDTGERYLSTPLFDDITEEMTEEEIALSESTPGYRFSAAACSLPAARPSKVDPDTERYVGELIRQEPVVLFALEWCEFCWSVRKLFALMGVPYTSVDLDSVEYQQDDRGGKIRAVLANELGTPTIPQVFVGGRHLGGCAELFDACSSGELQQRFSEIGVNFRAVDFEPRTLLPNWVHPRQSAA